ETKGDLQKLVAVCSIFSPIFEIERNVREKLSAYITCSGYSFATYISGLQSFYSRESSCVSAPSGWLKQASGRADDLCRGNYLDGGYGVECRLHTGRQDALFYETDSTASVVGHCCFAFSRGEVERARDRGVFGTI